MPLDADELSVWDIGFRWAEHDPARFWLRIPVAVRDNFRVLMKAILSGEIICQTLCLDKRPPDSKADRRFYIRTYIDDIYACIHDSRHDRKLLRWAAIDRADFLTWCSCRGISPPEFWFPPGWKTAYEHPQEIWPGLVVRHKEPEDNGTLVSFSYKWPEDLVTDDNKVPDVASDEHQRALRQNQAARVACRQVAAVLWQKNSNLRIAEVIRDELTQEYCGAKYFNEETIREWIKDIAPTHVRARRGRPTKKNGDEDL